MFKFLRSLFSAFTPPKPAGPPQKIATITPGSQLISDNASWIDHVVVVNGTSKDTVRILEFPLENLEQCLLGLEFQMSSSDVDEGAYPEMWINVQGFGEAFSKGFSFRLKDTNDWSTCELPFFLKQGQLATRLKLNVVFEGTGSVLLKDIELYATPLK